VKAQSAARVMCERENEVRGGEVAVEGSGSYEAWCEEKRGRGDSREVLNTCGICEVEIEWCAFYCV